MANSNSPRGLVPYAYAWGALHNGAGRVYYVPVGNATALFLGDPIAMISATSDGNGVGAVGIASAGAGDFLIGSFVGICNSAGELVIHPAARPRPLSRLRPRPSTSWWPTIRTLLY